ncbi:monocarboxylate transporter 13-like [Dermacentor andersoni]|uniref:monocarboxylate transporter 13-like n=1 Tax=Dermacentor andersoni TaxID=34620 RepID=UPI002154F889|nr:monocarboxylate transporter 11-like [Dermacentor andersoni]XP_050052790.1 monocarboxylate transporter 11-like [Dermacentor andersoni]XP_054919297.1 monocarboxylate transporter 11-like [Dermacentor andersoni]
MAKPQTSGAARKAVREGPDSARAWYLGVFCTMYAFFGWVGLSSTPVLYVGLIKHSGASREAASQPFTAMMCAYFTGSVLYGGLAHWFNEQKLLFAAAVIISSTLFASYFIVNITVLTVVLGVIHGLGVASVGVVVGALLSQYFIKYRATAFALMSVTLSLTGVVFPPVASYFVTEYGFSTSLLLLGALSLHLFLCCLPLAPQPWQREQAPRPPPPPTTLTGHKTPAVRENTNGHIVKQENTKQDTPKSTLIFKKMRPFLQGIFPICCTTNACGCFAIFTYTLTIVDFAHDCGFQGYQAAMLMTAMSVGWAVASVALAPAVDAGLTSKETVVFTSFVVQGVGFVFMAVLGEHYAWLVTGSILVGWGQGSRGFLLFVFVPERFPKGQIPLAFALMSLSCTLPFFARAPIIGYVRDTLGSYFMLMVGLAAMQVVLAVCWGALALLKWRHRTAKLRIALAFA